MGDNEKFINNKTIIKIIIAIVIALGVHFSNYGKIKSIAFIAAVICAILTALHFHQETCSNYQCPDGYVNDESKKDTECGGIADFTCDSVDKDTCCISKQKCSEYTCPTGYEGKDNSDKIYCKDSVCKESDDKDTCCNKSVNCEGSWSGFGACSLDCGEGTQTRTYTATKQPQYGGTPCPTTPESQPCNTEACDTCSSYECQGIYSNRADAADVSCGKTQCDSSNIDICCETIQGATGDGNPGGTGVANATCGSYECQGIYSNRADAADVSCGKTQCDSSNIDICCETIQITTGDGNPGGTGVANAKCSSLTCPSGYLNKPEQSDTSCSGTTCDLGVDINTCCKYWPDINSDGVIGVDDLLSSLSNYRANCGEIETKCLYSNRDSSKNYGVTDLLGLLAVFGQQIDDEFNCQILPNSISSVPNSSSRVSNICTHEECELTITCNADTPISTNWTCNHSSGEWLHVSSDSDLDDFNSCIGG